MNAKIPLAAAALVLAAGIPWGQPSAPPRTVLAVGAHAADMELTAGAILAHQRKAGDRIFMLHLTLGEGGNAKMPPSEYGAQKRREAEAAAKILGAEAIFGPYADGMLPDNDEARRYVAEVIRRTRPDIIITHWKNSIHKDHRVAHAITVDAVLMASLAAVKTEHPAHRGVRGVYYADNWEDAEGFRPYIYVDISDAFDQWKEAIRAYEMVRGGISSFAYFDYYASRARELGTLAGRQYAVALDVDEAAKKRVVDLLR